MKKITTLFAFFTIVLILASCSKGPKAPKVEGYETYTDNTSGLTIEYPKNWVKTTNPIRFVVFNSNEGKTRFVRYDPEGFPGAKIDINLFEMDSAMTIDSVIKKIKKFTDDVYEIKDVQFAGYPAKKLTYTFELNSGVFYGETYVLQNDPTTVNVFQIEAFDGTYDKYKEAFDRAIKSFKPGKFPSATSDTVKTVTEQPPPSKTLVTKSGMGYSIKIPDNFSAERGPSSSGVLESKNYIGTRRADCNIVVDVIDASKNKNLQKIVEENRPNYKNATPQKTKIGGKDAYVMSYSARKDVLSRVYFVINGDKLYRITMNWFAGEQQDYLPIFEQCIQSFRFE
ncbi:MAG TPA: PsbP-related protein [Candidatus Kapabacteria bacterium]|jgi:hypothetical protein|nr:PsbP-related protein [Candidatus Kapabacteria bacterium]